MTLALAEPIAARKHGGLLPQEWHEVTAPPLDIARAAAALSAAYGAGTLETDELSRLVGCLASRTELWKPLVVCDPTRRRYRLMLDDERLDVWVLSWMPGQSTGYHDHGNSNVALAALEGCVLERQIRVGCASLERELRPGVVQPGPAGYIHSVAHHTGAPAVTLHAYSPPLVQRGGRPRRCSRAVGQYRAGPQGVLLREQQHGRQELLDHTIEDARVTRGSI